MHLHLEVVRSSAIHDRQAGCEECLSEAIALRPDVTRRGIMILIAGSTRFSSCTHRDPQRSIVCQENRGVQSFWTLRTSRALDSGDPIQLFSHHPVSHYAFEVLMIFIQAVRDTVKVIYKTPDESVTRALCGITYACCREDRR